MTRSIIDVIGRPEAFKLMEGAILKAVNDNERLGLPKNVMVNGVVYRQYVDGSLERVEVTNGVLAKPQAPPVTRQ